LEQADGSGPVAEDEEATTPKPAAARPDSLEGTGQVGTYLYTAPEIEQGWPKIDEKVSGMM
jgi:translation initiation factor 2-alpha kinase 4